MRGGTAPLQIETSRYIGFPVEERICRSCNTQQVEDEQRFCVGCPSALEEARDPLLHLLNFIKWTLEHFLIRTSSSQSCRAQTVEQPNFIIVASLNEPHASETALRRCVCIRPTDRLCLRPYTVNFKCAFKYFPKIERPRPHALACRMTLLGYCQSAALATVAETARV